VISSQEADILKMEELRVGASLENLQAELLILSPSLLLEFNALILQAVLDSIESS
jgi:hypothetical protein